MIDWARMHNHCTWGKFLQPLSVESEATMILAEGVSSNIIHVVTLKLNTKPHVNACPAHSFIKIRENLNSGSFALGREKLFRTAYRNFGTQFSQNIEVGARNSAVTN